MHVVEDIQYQYFNGFISDENWRRPREAFKEGVGTIETRPLYERNRGVWRNSSRQIVDQIIAEIDAEATSVMDSAKINDWLQVVGLFGVIGSLMFVGLQMKQDREIALSAASQARTDTTIQNIMDSAANPYYMAAADKVQAGNAGSLTPSEARALSLTSTAVLFNFENVHFQYASGFISEERWSGTRESLKALLSVPWARVKPTRPTLLHGENHFKKSSTN
jgi:hypothetical protein